MISQASPEPPALPIPAPREDLCLDYANTLCWRGSEAPAESLAGPADLLRWLGSSSGLPPALLDEATEWTQAAPDEAARFFAQAIALREAIYRLFSAVVSGDRVAEDDIASLNSALAAAPPRRRVLWSEAGFAWAGEPPRPGMPFLLAPVLWSAADLLTRADRLHVRCCANEKCRWLFLDRSKGGTRRWCDMSSCGNRAKSHRHYLRTKPG